MTCVTPQDMDAPTTVDEFVSLFNQQLLQAPLGNDTYSVVIPYYTTEQNQDDIESWYTQCGWIDVICTYNSGFTQIFLTRP
jgi:hypothetical protein